MKTNLERFFSSFVTTIVLLLIYAFGLAVATFIEKYHGTATAKAMVYYSPLFFLLQFLLVVNFIAATIKHQYLKRGKWGLMLTHFAFIIILLGALTSFLFGEEGILHLREGETSNQIAVRTSDNTTFHTLPFSVELKKFTLTRYPGSASPSSYESEVIVHVDGEDREERIFMNNVLDVKGYRFFQASYDQDEHGTILSVNRDVAGRNITYTGYLLLVIGLILCLVGKDSRFMRQSRRLKELRKATNVTVLLLALLAVPLSVNAGGKASPMLDAVQKYAVSPEHAALFGALPIQSGSGRMMPVNTFSSEILRKLHKSDKIGQLNSDQFLLSLLAMPDMWMRVPFIALSNPELAAYYDLTDGECAYIQAFDSNGNYKLQEKLEEAYNKMDVFRYCKIGYLVLGGLLLVLSFAMLFRRTRWMKVAVWLLGAGVLVVFHYHMFGMGMRWYIGGYAPWSNSYETMVYVGWATVLAGLLFVRRSTITFALATLFGGIILFVSGLNWMDPEINPLVPVLKSPWLMFHVAVIVAAYGFFGISCLIGLTNMVMMSVAGKKNKEILKARITELSIVGEMALWVGLALMTVGTFLGAVWANESWGRYWGWDPKETWALITMVVYAVVTHLHLVKRWNSLWLFNLASVIAFASVLMTFFGVNYFLSGMHSYGQNDNVHGIFTYLYIALGVVIVLAVLSYRRWKTKV